MDGNKFNINLSGNGGNGNNGNHHSGLLPGETANNESTNFERLFYIVWGYKWIVLAVIVVCVGLAYWYAKNQTPIYKSTGTVMIAPSQGRRQLTGNGLSKLLNSKYGVGLSRSLGDQLAILQSRKLSKQIADTLMQLNRMKNGELYPVLYKSYPDNPTMIKNKDAVAARVRGGLSFGEGNKQDKISSSHLVAVSFTSPSPLEAKSIANLTIDQYIKYSINRNRFAANSAVGFLKGELKKRKHQLQQASQKLKRYMQNNDLVSIDAQTQTMIKRHANLVGQLHKAQNELIATKSGIAQYKNQLNNLKPGLANQFSKAVGPKMSRLQFQLAEFQTRKMKLLTNNPRLKKEGVQSPQLKNLNRKIKDYKNKIHQLTEKLLENNEDYLGFIGGSKNVINQISNVNQKLIGLQVKKKQYQSQVNALSNQIDALNRRTNNLPENITDYARLKQKVALKKQLYASVSKQYANMKLWQQTRVGQGRLVDEAFLPHSPIAPRPKYIMVVGLIIGCILGLGFVFVRETFNTKVDDVAKLKQLDDGHSHYKLPLLAVIPTVQDFVDSVYDGKDVTDVEGKEISTRLVSYLKPMSPFADSFRQLEAGIVHSSPGQNLKTVAITSTTMGEGKSLITSNLGVIMAEAGHNVIVIDTDFRRYKIDKIFGSSQTPGISDILFDDLTLEETIKPTVVSNLDILTVGQHTSNPARILKSDRIFLILEELEKTYDFVLIDSPPVGIISDSMMIMDDVDGVVAVTRFLKTQTMDVQHMLNKLNKADANVIGTVLNDFDPGKSNSGGYNSNYYHKLYQEYEDYSTGVEA